jgi:hypothetical protein
MSDKLRKVDYFYTDIPNTPGQAAKIMAGLADAGVNLLAFSGFPDGRRSQLDLVPDDSAKLKRAAKTMGLKLSAKKTGFLLTGDDRVGAVTALLGKLAGAEINVTAIEPFPRDGRWRTFLGEAGKRCQGREAAQPADGALPEVGRGAVRSSRVIPARCAKSSS